MVQSSKKLKTSSQPSLNGSLPEQPGDMLQNVFAYLEFERLETDSDNQLEVRINDWLDSQNILMVRPEDIINDFYHKKRISSFNRILIELQESVAESMDDFYGHVLEYNHLQKGVRLESDLHKKNIEFKSPINKDKNKLSNSSKFSVIKNECLSSPVISSLFKRRIHLSSLSI